MVYFWSGMVGALYPVRTLIFAGVFFGLLFLHFANKTSPAEEARASEQRYLASEMAERKRAQEITDKYSKAFCAKIKASPSQMVCSNLGGESSVERVPGGRWYQCGKGA